VTDREVKVGYVVYYWGSIESGDKPLPALVCQVHEPRYVNLAVFLQTGVPWARELVRIYQDGDPLPHQGTYATFREVLDVTVTLATDQEVAKALEGSESSSEAPEAGLAPDASSSEGEVVVDVIPASGSRH
jgi:hypothetical protein